MSRLSGASRASRPVRPRQRANRSPLWRGGAALAIGAALAGGAVLGLAAPASAHNYMIASTPAVNGTLTSLPKDFEITTNDRLLDIGGTNSGFAFRIVGPNGKYYDNGCLVVDGPSMTTRASLGASGKYTVQWQIISADGHTVSDQYTFTWDAPTSFTPATGSRTPPVCTSGPGAQTSAAAAAGSSGSTSSSSSTLSDAVWIGAGGLVVVALVVVVLLLLRRPAEPRAGRSGDGDPDEDDDARD